jgi:hypothetical protein
MNGNFNPCSNQYLIGPSGKRLLLTDANGNNERTVEVPAGWER